MEMIEVIYFVVGGGFEFGDVDDLPLQPRKN